MNPVKALENHGQAIWLDFLARGFVAKGDLKALIDTDGVKGVTSNPSIFEKAIGSSDEYDGAIGQRPEGGRPPRRRPVRGASPSRTSRTPPTCCARSTTAWTATTVSSASRSRPIWRWTPRAPSRKPNGSGRTSSGKNLMVKVPATPEGLPAIEHLIGEGISINITLLFSQEVYREVAEAYIAGLEKYVASGGDPAPVASVASLLRQPHR